MRQTPVSASPARMARSTGAAPRQRGSSEKCTFNIGTWLRRSAGMIRPKATTTASSTPAVATSSNSWDTGSPRSTAAALTGLGVVVPPRPRRRSGRVTHSTTSWPASTRARSGGTAICGVPRKARRDTAPTVRGRRRSSADRVRGEPVEGSVVAGRRSQPRKRLDSPSGSPGAEVERAGAQDLEGLFALVLVEPLHQQDAVEVVQLVLEDAAFELGRLDGDLVAVEVESPPGALRWAARSPS